MMNSIAAFAVSSPILHNPMVGLFFLGRHA